MRFGRPADRGPAAEQASAAELLLAPAGPALPARTADVVIGVFPAVGRDVWRSLSADRAGRTGELLAGWRRRAARAGWSGQ